MHKAKYDLSVLLIFFTRPDSLEKVFEKVRQARPAKLFLACDGPRKDRPEDIEKINQCKSIVPKFSLVSNIGLGAGAPHGVIEHNPIPSIFMPRSTSLHFLLSTCLL